MDQNKVREYFDRLAPEWDAGIVRDEQVIREILDGAEIGAGQDVLDVACGTGVLIPDYLARGVRSVTGIDLSPVMIAEARGKFRDPRVRFLCGDAEREPFGRLFDRVVVYNALPHFPEPGRLVAAMAALLPPGGVLTVAHGMSRAKIDRHHEGGASPVSMGLLHEDALAALFAPYFDVTVKRSDGRMYQVAGRRRETDGDTGNCGGNMV